MKIAVWLIVNSICKTLQKVFHHVEKLEVNKYLKKEVLNFMKTKTEMQALSLLPKRVSVQKFLFS